MRLASTDDAARTPKLKFSIVKPFEAATDFRKLAAEHLGVPKERVRAVEVRVRGLVFRRIVCARAYPDPDRPGGILVLVQIIEPEEETCS